MGLIKDISTGEELFAVHPDVEQSVIKATGSMAFIDFDKDDFMIVLPINRVYRSMTKLSGVVFIEKKAFKKLIAITDEVA